MFQSQFDPTTETKTHQVRLYIIFGIGLFLAFCKFVGQPQFALSEVITYMLFLCGAIYTNYCMIVFYIILTLFSMISYFMYFGQLAQIHVGTGISSLVAMDWRGRFFFIILLITFVFDIIAITLAFWAYKAFKFESFKGFTAGRGGAGRRAEEDGGRGSGRNQAQPFQGRGVRIGD